MNDKKTKIKDKKFFLSLKHALTRACDSLYSGPAERGIKM